MTLMYAEVGGMVDAPPAAVYAVLADYRKDHPAILPRRYFTGLEVVRGGQGAGTVVVVHVRALGSTFTSRLTVSEPDPGRVLMEKDGCAGIETTYTLTPIDEGTRAHVRISTVARSKNGLPGLFERLIAPRLMRRIYRAELRRLASYVEAREALARLLNEAADAA